MCKDLQEHVRSGGISTKDCIFLFLAERGTWVGLRK